MAKDLDLALAYARRAGVPARIDRGGAPAADRGQHRRLRARGLLGRGQGGPGARRRAMTSTGRRCPTPALILAADHRAPRRDDHRRTTADFSGCAGAGPAPLRRDPGDGAAAGDLAAAGHITAPAPHLPLHQPHRPGRLGLRARRPAGGHRARAAADGWTGVKHMTRIDMADPMTAPALELLGQVLEQSRQPASRRWSNRWSGATGACAATPTPIVFAAAHRARHGGAGDQGARARGADPGAERQRAVARVVASVGVPVLFLGGPRSRGAGATRVLDEVRDVMEGGGARHGDGSHPLPGPGPGGDGRPRRTCSCTADDPHHRLRDHGHQGGPVGRRRSRRHWRAPS